MKSINDWFDKIFVISFKDDIEHRSYISKYLNKYNIDFSFIDAIDGFNDRKIKRYYQDYLNWKFHDKKTHETERLYKRKLIKSEGALGLLLTYKKIFELAIKKEYNNILVLEDDILFDKDIVKKTNTLLTHIENYDLIYLGASHHIWKNPSIIDIDDISYYKAPEVLDGSFAVAYNKNVFRKLLDLINKKNAPVDLVLRSIIRKNNSYVTYPNFIIAETTKESKTSFSIRNLRNHANNVKWNLSNIDFTRGILKVSIIIACHNNKDTIKNCIDSALNQTYQNIEIIAIDDCSNDGSYEILKSYGDKIKLIKLNENVGAYKCRNIGLDNSSGFFITLLDADDIMMSKKIETDVYNYYNNPHCDIFFSNIYRSQDINNIISIEDSILQNQIDEEREPFLNANSSKYIWGHNAPWHYKYRVGMQTIFVEKEFFNKYGKWRDDFRYGMDIELIQRYTVKKYKQFIDNESLFKLLYTYNTEYNYGIYLSKSMNYFSYPMNNNNATNICSGSDRKQIHDITNKDLISMIEDTMGDIYDSKVNISNT